LDVVLSVTYLVINNGLHVERNAPAKKASGYFA
jgi:hypothetical protein